ncbi:MAG: NTP transferase domain-containing protein [Planctomycetota bacterium]|nr:NTP transferase domain-containing protein [Planctomycetota bacterium]
MFSLVVLAAGKGSRMKSDLPKVLHKLMGEPLLEYALETADKLAPERLVVVIGHGREKILERFSNRKFAGDRKITWAVQEEQLGTGHAAKIGIDALDEAQEAGSVFIVNGDLPFLRTATLQEMLEKHASSSSDVTVLACTKSDPRGFGRIIRNEGEFAGIVEEKDADEQTANICEVNVGTYLMGVDVFNKNYESTNTDNDQGERYLTDVVVQACRSGSRVETVQVADENETAQVNSQAELSAAQRIMKDQLIVNHLEDGVRIDDPSSTYIEKGAVIASGARIHPFCVVRAGVQIGPGCEVGPFAHLRPGARLEKNAKVGNYVEIKNSRLGPGSKTNHLSYVGDGDVGARVNIGAGTIFANYDGTSKNQVTVGDDAFIGSGSVLVAPVTIGENSMTGAGAVVLRGRDVPDGGIVVGVPAKTHKQDGNGDSGDCQN